MRMNDHEVKEEGEKKMPELSGNKIKLKDGRQGNEKLILRI